MKNIFILSTDKTSRFYITNEGNFGFSQHYLNDDRQTMKNKNIYITSDKEIKEGDWHLSFLRDKFEVINYLPNGGYRKECLGKEVCKIILTTDQDLINDGVQAIDDEFLEWFVKNPSCESVEVEMNQGRYFDYGGNIHITNAYKIIIPKEEPKQEKLEEAAKTHLNSGAIPNNYQSFIEGAEWQAKRMYSEEEVINLIQFLSMNEEFNGYSSVSIETAKHFLKQFKKK